MENTINSRKKGKILSSWTEHNFSFFRVFIIKPRNWIIPLKSARLLATHDGGKLTRVGELSLAGRLQGIKVG